MQRIRGNLSYSARTAEDQAYWRAAKEGVYAFGTVRRHTPRQLAERERTLARRREARTRQRRARRHQRRLAA